MWLYDFKRLDTEWNRHIPGAVMVIKHASFWHGMVTWPEQVGLVSLWRTSSYPKRNASFRFEACIEKI